VKEKMGTHVAQVEEQLGRLLAQKETAAVQRQCGPPRPFWLREALRRDAQEEAGVMWWCIGAQHMAAPWTPDVLQMMV
jgi:hypothetical protein